MFFSLLPPIDPPMIRGKQSVVNDVICDRIHQISVSGHSPHILVDSARCRPALEQWAGRSTVILLLPSSIDLLTKIVKTFLGQISELDGKNVFQITLNTLPLANFKSYNLSHNIKDFFTDEVDFEKGWS